MITMSPFLHSHLPSRFKTLVSQIDVRFCRRTGWQEQVDKGNGQETYPSCFTHPVRRASPKGVMLSYDNLVISSKNANSFDSFR